MKKVTFELDNFDEQKQRELTESLLKDARVTALLDRYGADRQVVEDNAWIIKEWLEELDRQADQYGNVSFQNNPDSYYRDLEIMDGTVQVVIRKTTHQKDSEERYGFKKNYLIFDMSMDMLDYDIDKIDLTGESESYAKVVNIVRQWLATRPDKGLYLWGGFGVGKTYLAAAMTNYLARQGAKVAFVNVPGFFSRARSSMVTQASFTDSSLKRMKQADYLVMDDIGAEMVTNWVRDDILLPVLDYRMEHHLSTIFTSNSDFNDLHERLMYNQYGQKDEMKADRIMERIRTLSVEIKVTGSSRRK